MAAVAIEAVALKKPGLAKLETKVAEKEMTTIYRNFGWNELESIKILEVNFQFIQINFKVSSFG